MISQRRRELVTSLVERRHGLDRRGPEARRNEDRRGYRHAARWAAIP